MRERHRARPTISPPGGGRKARPARGRCRIIVCAAVCFAACVALCAAGLWWFGWESPYRSALALREQADYDGAASLFLPLSGYRDAFDEWIETKWQQAGAAQASGDYDTAIALYSTLTRYRDAAPEIQACKYGYALGLLAKRRYAEALDAFTALGDYQDSRRHALDAQYGIAEELIRMERYPDAITLITTLVDRHEKASALLLEANYRQAGALAELGLAYEAMSLYLNLGDYADAQELANALSVPDLSLARTLAAGNRHLARVRRDGTVRAEGDDEYGQCDVGAWTDIVSVAVGEVHTVGLRVNGSVTAAGSDAFGQVRCVGLGRDVRAIRGTSRAERSRFANDGTRAVPPILPILPYRTGGRSWPSPRDGTISSRCAATARCFRAAPARSGSAGLRIAATWRPSRLGLTVRSLYMGTGR